MDQTALVDRDIDEGRKLVQALDAEAFPVVAALWYFFSDEDVWRLIIASPKVAVDGPRAAYSEIQKVIRTHEIHLPLQRISALEPDDPLVTALRIFAPTDGAPYVGGTHLHRTSVGDVFVEGAYVHRAERLIASSGAQEVTAVLPDKQTKVWKAYPCVLTVKEGLVQEVKVEGHQWPQSRSRHGVNVHLFVLERQTTKDGETFGDVERWTVVDGRLRSVENAARNVRVEGLVDTKLTA
jgi:hypothetical protein